MAQQREAGYTFPGELAGGRGLRAAVTKALGWQTLATVVAQVIQSAVTLTAAALTAPKDFALWGVATVIFNAQNLVGSLGLGPALVYRKDDERRRDAVDGAFYVTLALGVGIAAVVFGAASPIASFFSKGFSHRDVESAVRVMSVVFACTTIANVPQALIEKTLDFRRRAVPDLSGSLTYAGLSAVLLVAGFGIWSLILAKAFQSLLLVAFFWAASPIKPRLRPQFHWPVVRMLLSYGKFSSGAALLGFLIANGDNIAIGRWFGAAALGAYALAFTVANLVPTFLTATLGTVFFPLYARVREDPSTLKNAFQSALHYVALVIVPAAVALASVAPAAFVDAFGRRWEASSPLIRILALYALARAFASAATNLLAASGRPSVMLSTQVANFLVTVAALWPALHFGVAGLAGAFAAGQAAALVFSLRATRHLLDAALVVRLRGLTTAVTLGLFAALSVKLLANGHLSDYAALASFALVYGAGILVLDQRVRASCNLLLRALLRAST